MILVILCLFSLSPTSSGNLKLNIVKKRIMAGELPLQVYSKSFLSAGIFFLGVIQIFPRIWKTKGAHSVTALLFVVLIMPITPRYSLWNLRYYLWMEIFELRVTQIFSQVLYQTLQTTKVKFSDSEKPQLQSVSIFFNFCPSVPPFVFAYYSNLLLIFKAVILMFHSIWWLLSLFEFW